MQPYGMIYLTTNAVNGMQYVGQTHYSTKMRDDYFGSGKAIKRAILKYGKKSFERITLFEAFDKESLDWAERTIIADLDAVASRRFYNIAPGGRASLGFSGKKHTAERNAALSKKMKGHAVTDAARAACQQTGKANVANMNALRAECIHCGKVAQKGLITRWHNNNCKSAGVRA